MEICMENVTIVYTGEDKKVIEVLNNLKGISGGDILERYTEDDWYKWEDYITGKCEAVGDYDLNNDSIGQYEYYGAIGYDIQDDYASVTSEVLVNDVLPITIGLLYSMILEDSGNLFDFLTDDLPASEIDDEKWELRIIDKEDIELNKWVDVLIQLSYTSQIEGE